MQHLNLELHTSKAQTVQPNHSTWQQKGILTQFKLYYLLKSIQMLLFCLILYTAKLLILQVNVEGIPLLEENATRYQFVAIPGACLHWRWYHRWSTCLDDGSTDWVIVFVWNWNATKMSIFCYFESFFALTMVLQIE